MIKCRLYIFFLLSILVISCKEKTLFQKVSSSHSGIHFNNAITENDSMNIIDLENIYNGGGVGIADFNNDGLPDIYFTGNMVANKLYLNKGKLQFEDITAVAGVDGEGKWSRGVSVVDINNDGWQDIYVSETILIDSTKRENILYINKGLNKDGIPVFKDEAKEYGLNDNSHTTQTAFFDYDNDGDLDVYMVANVFARHDNPNIFRKKFINGEHPSTDRLYRNDWDPVKGHPVFTNVSRQAGILQEGFGHSVTICDINQDGWKDVFVTNDYLTENLLWINNHNGTFTNQSKDYFKHTAYNAMGADVVDINNDGLSDVIELDMNPEDNYRKKTMLSGANYQSYLYNNDYDFQYQYIRNNLHLNLGNKVGANDSIGHPVFGDISFYSGIAETDWSWAPLVADFDNDSYRDLIVTNGFPKDVTDHDFMAYRNSAFGMNDKKKLLSLIPEVKIPNYAFHNNGNLKFSNSTKEWGFNQPTFSNGAIAADLDNDGDLDVVINNINDEALVYENKLNEQKEKPHHYLQVGLQGDSLNKGAFGSWVKIYYNKDKQQVYETNPVRGYLSSVPNVAYFGLGDNTSVDSLVIIWPDNTIQKQINVKADQQLVVKKSSSGHKYNWHQEDISNNAWFMEISDSLNISFKHQQNDLNDFKIQRLMPHKLSESGPALANGDINGDGLDDFIIGGSATFSAAVFLQKPNGKFERKNLMDSVKASLKLSDDAGIILFDADGDKDLDLYMASGGYEQAAGSTAYQDKLYINDGKGNFTDDSQALPVNYTSKSCVKAFDFDKDGDLDLFIGGRVEPWSYPKPVSSIVLRNDSKNGTVKFTDVTKTVAPALVNIGLVCDAITTDYNNDGWTDLVIAGEWMPLTFLKNQHGVFVDETKSTGIADKTGWWNCIAAGDFDKDGKIDFIAGNLGLNSFFSDNENYPLTNYYGDFDNNGTAKTFPTKYLKDKAGTYKEYPAVSRDEVIDQLPVVKKKFLMYKEFADASVDKIFTPQQLGKAIKSQANYFASSFIKNMGSGKFEIHPLPQMAQLSSLKGICIDDVDKDGNPDILLSGNDYGMEVFSGRQDAMNGLVLKGDGKGGFVPLSIKQSGLYIPGDGRGVMKVKNGNGSNLFVVGQNKGLIKVFTGRK